MFFFNPGSKSVGAVFVRFHYLLKKTSKHCAIRKQPQAQSCRKNRCLSLLQNAMQIVGFMDHETESVLEVVATVLKLGNIEFKPESRVNGLDESKIKDKNGKLVGEPLASGLWL